MPKTWMPKTWKAGEAKGKSWNDPKRVRCGQRVGTTLSQQSNLGKVDGFQQWFTFKLFSIHPGSS